MPLEEIDIYRCTEYDRGCARTEYVGIAELHVQYVPLQYVIETRIGSSDVLAEGTTLHYVAIGQRRYVVKDKKEGERRRSVTIREDETVLFRHCSERTTTTIWLLEDE